MTTEIKDLAQTYSELFERKKTLDDELKDVKEQLAAAKTQLIDAMAEADIDSISTGGYSYTPVAKTHYSKKAGVSYEELQAALAGYDCGDIVALYVNSRTLEAAVRSIVNTGNGELPEDLADIVSTYDDYDLSRTKR